MLLTPAESATVSRAEQSEESTRGNTENVVLNLENCTERGTLNEILNNNSIEEPSEECSEKCTEEELTALLSAAKYGTKVLARVDTSINTSKGFLRAEGS